MNSFSVNPFRGGTMFKYNYLNEWCKRLHTAALTKDSRTIMELTENMQSSDIRRNPIKLAINTNYEYVIPDIVHALKQVDGLDSYRIARLLTLSNCPIKNVISQQSIDIVEHMIRLGMSVNEAPDSQSVWRTSALHTAVAGGDSHLSAVKLLLDHGADPHYTDSLGFTPLHRCVEARNCLGVLRLLVERGARANTHDVSGTSALFTAIRHNQPLEVIKLLVRAGADVTERTTDGVTVMHRASQQMRRDLIEYLLDLGIDPNTRNHHGETVLYDAIKNAPLDFFRYLVEVCGVDVNLGNAVDISLLHVVYGSPSFCTLTSKRDYKVIADKIRFCLLRGADVNARNRHDLSILQMCEMSLTMYHGNWLDVMVEHIAMREFMNLPVDEHNAKVVYNNDCCVSYVVACKIEMVALMDLHFYNDVSLFNILTDDDAKIMGYVRNEDLVAAFHKISEMQLFQIYSETLSERFSHFLDMHVVQQKALKVLSCTLSSVTNYVAVHEIAKHLSNMDLLKLSRFCKE